MPADIDQGKSFRRHALFAVLTQIAAIWLATGTMVPYAATVEHPTVLEPCHYLVNVDHPHFEAVFYMIAGADPSTWRGSVVLRRILFPVIAHPFVDAFGILIGGVIASVLLQTVALLVFSVFVRRRFGDRGALTVLWLLATYPGVTYWAGLPYSYVVIVPGSLFGLLLLYRLRDATTFGQVFRFGFWLGVIFCGYDLFPFFGPAALMVLTWRRRFLWAAGSVVAIALPLLLVLAMLTAIGVPVLNSNTAGYAVVVLAWLRPFADVEGWLRHLVELPLVFVSNFVFGNFIVLPLLFVGAYFIGRRKDVTILGDPEKALLLSALILFVFNNAAPPYLGWQLRGHWLARLYQPVFPLFLIAFARLSDALCDDGWRRWRFALAVASAINASIAFGPVLLNPLAAYAYHRFYVHSPPESLLVNVHRFGRRPLGICDESHRWDRLPNPNTPFNRPRYMYRYADEHER